MPKTKVHCPSCGRRVETETIVRTAPGVAHTFSAEPGELTACECGKMLEYQGQPGKLMAKLAQPSRVRAFKEIEREGFARPRLSSVVEYIRTFRTMPPLNHAPTIDSGPFLKHCELEINGAKLSGTCRIYRADDGSR
jgi:hypothetical protein